MKLWLLRPVDENSMPWDPWYDKVFGFVIRAKSETEARELAQKQGGDEAAQPCWTLAELTTCVELTSEGEVGVVIHDFHAA